VAERGRFRPQFSPTLVDYNAWGTGGAEPFAGIGYQGLAEQNAWDRHSKFVAADKVFQETIRSPAGDPYYSSNLQGKVIPKDWWFEHYLLMPRGDSPLVDAGTVLPNLSGPYLGSAPDLGAHELGLGTAWYGPRTWDDRSGLIYGVPDGWKKLPAANSSQYARLGCPTSSGERDVLLARSNPDAYALLQLVPLDGEKRWNALESLADSNDAALTPKLEFQEGLTARLYRKSEYAQLVAGRIEPAGMLRVTSGCRPEDLPAVRTDLFRIVRSLVQ
jgi:hypothetical protein